MKVRTDPRLAYDPAIGRFMQADNSVPDQNDLQSFNRMSYEAVAKLSNPDKAS